MRLRKFTVISVLLLVVGGILWIAVQRRAAAAERAAPELLVVPVERGPVVRQVIASGRLNPLRTVQVGSQISGVIVELPADFNTPVRRGEVVARLDTATYEAHLRLAQAELERAVAAADLARMQVDRISRLHRDSLVPPAEMEEARIGLRQATAAVRIREEHVEQARLELERCTIISPTDGIVISRNVDVGQTVAASLSAPVLFEIAEDLTRMMINARVPEADIGNVREGQRVEFKVDAYRDQVRQGSVMQIRKAPIIVDNVVAYDTVIHVDNQDLTLNPGMTAEITIITDERTDVLRVRNLALRARLPDWLAPPTPSDLPDGARIVYRLRDPNDPRSLEPVPVRTGLADLVYTEIHDGVSAGDSLVTGVAPRRSAGRERPTSVLTGSQAQY
jgi:HlyD family secretion protein